MQRVKILFIIFVFSANTVKGETPLMSNGGIEVKAKQFSSYLSDLGLRTDDLNWGPPVKGIKMSALFLPPKDQRLVGFGETTLVISIQNQSNIPLVIPLIDDLPMFSIFTSESPRKALFKRLAGGAMFSSGVIKLDAGKMITFNHNYSIDELNKDRVPMLLSITFKSWAGAEIPEIERGVILESNEIQFP